MKIRNPLTFSVRSSFFILIFLSSGLFAQEVVRLPEVLPEEDSPPGQLVSHPDSSSQLLQVPGQLGVPPADSEPGSLLDLTPREKLPPGVRNGFFQKLLFDYTWLAPGGADGLGTNDLRLQSIFAMPCPTINSPLIITPGFAVHYLQGPRDANLPPRLHEGYVQFRWMTQATPKLGIDLAFTPGIFSDFNQENSKAMRYTGHGALAWTWNETTKFVAGIGYLDRPDIEFIPIGGVVWTPREDLKFDLIFPTPRISQRVYWAGNCGDEVQDWAYVAGEFNGDAWAIKNSLGMDDLVVLSDYRLVLGLERKVQGGLSSRFEVGYVFGRRIRYRSDLPDFHPTDTVMLRCGLTY